MFNLPEFDKSLKDKWIFKSINSDPEWHEIATLENRQIDYLGQRKPTMPLYLKQLKPILGQCY